MALNTELLRQVRDKIASTPEAYDQEVYGRPETLAPCGTAACIAGWTCVLAGELPIEQVRRVNARGYAEDEAVEPFFQIVPDTAARLLGLNAHEAETLFTGHPQGDDPDWDDDEEYRDGGWPEPFATEWAEAEKPPSEIAAAYLDECIKRGKVTW